MDNDLFKQTDDNTDHSGVDPLELIKQKFGEGDEKLLRAKFESDNFIKQLQKENAELRQEVSSKATIDEVLTQIRSLSPKEPTSQQSVNQNPNPTDAIDNSKIEELVSSIFSKKEQETKLEQNKRLVAEKLVDVWGNDANLHLNKKAKELNVSLSELQRLGESNPSVLFSALGILNNTSNPNKTVAPPGSANTGFVGTASVKNKAYYDKMKQTDKLKYLSKETQMEMMKEAMKQGDAFFN